MYNNLIKDEQYQNIAFIKVDANNRANQEFVNYYQIRFVPTLYTYNAEGERVWEYVGPIDEDTFRTKLDEILN
ncbi:hypothetical protein BHF68_10890 [Desulfuribacillus alkaliarsenatis]|uniref:Thioredoxin domain-containing protein n=1 Tax=Desulfuribacillus alkaliarsenatis TaxID=766136 RepID=A0A1E5FZ88_9FIRM|nr:hypothetical protein BHF68_10890 [Desulfuribacillus alkaliarsenatis]